MFKINVHAKIGNLDQETAQCVYSTNRNHRGRVDFAGLTTHEIHPVYK